MSEFSDQIVLITGAGRGTGRVIALAFGEQDAVVAANDITPINADQTVESITTAGGRAKTYLADVAKKMPTQRMISEVLEDWGRIDILVNNAGVSPHAEFLNLDEWDWRRALDVNLSGPFFTMQSVGRVMREAGGGVIVNIAADTRQAWSDQAAFVASKAGLIGLTRQAAQELAAYKIRVNAICPQALYPDSGSQGEGRPTAPTPRHLKSQVANADEVAQQVLFLCSQAASHISGQVIDLSESLDPPVDV
ncbi:MAG: SDR family oxidoreductase [Anaerolineales bacterium]|jgi:NAD(P)-dependent dehydrogenase (short-subunit alcohol dehydrogenase family)